MSKQNLHTHSLYCDGSDTIEAMVQTAIAKGFGTLGFSGHGNCRHIDNYSMDEKNTQKYIHDVLTAKEKYKDQIDIFLGIEQDVLGQRFFREKGYQYVIGSVHFVKAGEEYLAVDESVQVTKQIVDHFGSFLNYAKSYFEEVKKVIRLDEVDIIGHLDLLTKFNEHEEFVAFSDPDYLDMAYECIDLGIKENKIFEVNTGAIARGYRQSPYPHQLLLQYIYDHGGKICLNSDCHQKEMLDCYYGEAIKQIRQCGFTTMMALTNHGFVEKDIDYFL